MSICVRGGDWFNERPFAQGEKQWRDFRRRLLSEGRKTVILELGVGMNTPGVLRWPNEDLTQRNEGNVRLVRVGLGPQSGVPVDLEERGLAIAIEGDIATVLRELL